MLEKKLIDKVIYLDLIDQLLEMLLGNSEYSDEKSFDKLDRYSSRLLLLTIEHLQFVSYHGVEYLDKKSSVRVGDKIFSSYPEYYEAWVLAGIPGVSIHKLEKMLDKYQH